MLKITITDLYETKKDETHITALKSRTWSAHIGRVGLMLLITLLLVTAYFYIDGSDMGKVRRLMIVVLCLIPITFIRISLKSKPSDNDTIDYFSEKISGVKIVDIHKRTRPGQPETFLEIATAHNVSIDTVTRISNYPDQG